ncbi:hypothetical protein [Streptomyces sp. NPDC017993]|uniref:hypothetical protein n=1 Tax=Streptomyces sp. NPDC017993 TaxID=3365027 RepID=UPI0037ABC8BB
MPTRSDDGHRKQARVAATHHHIDRPPLPRKHPRPDYPFCAIIHDGAPSANVCERADALAIVPRSGGCTEGHLLVQQWGGRWNYLISCGPDATQTVMHLHGYQGSFVWSS